MAGSPAAIGMPTLFPTHTSTLPPTDTLAPSITPTIQPTDTHTPVPTLPAEIYPSPLPFLTPVAWPGTSSLCPNPDGLEASSTPSLEVVAELLNHLNSGDLYQRRHASDPAFWPALNAGWKGEDRTITPEDVMVQPANETPYKSLIEIGCGKQILDLSWWVVDCRGPCSDPNLPLGIESNFYLVNRDGTWLVWALY